MNTFRSGISAFKRNEDGSIAILFALTLTIVVGIAGGAVDFGRAFAERQHLQASVDAAAVAGARAVALQVGDAATTATEIFNSNYETRGGGPTPNVQVVGQKVSVSASIGVPAFLI